MRFLTVSLLGILLIFSSRTAAENSTYASDFKLLKATTGRAVYELALLKLVLDSTVDTYGSYSLEHVSLSAGTARGRRELEHGNLFNINIAPIRPEKIAKQEKIFVIRTPVMRGLLGYRGLITSPENIPKIKKIRKLDQLKEIVLGQGQGWLDSIIYRHSGVEVVDIANYDLLFPMLERGRFDAIPLGVTEIEQAIDKRADKFVIVPNLILYYPFPVVFQVSHQYPIHAQRIHEGLRKIQENGDFDTLFNQYFKSTLQRFFHKESIFISLENPMLEDVLGLPKKGEWLNQEVLKH